MNGFLKWSREIAKLFLLSSQLGPPTNSPAGECVPPLASGIQGDRRGSPGGGGGPNVDEGQTMDQITLKTPNPKCRLYWCLVEFMD